jgi:hypothetical protein
VLLFTGMVAMVIVFGRTQFPTFTPPHQSVGGGNVLLVPVPVPSSHHGVVGVGATELMKHEAGVNTHFSKFDFFRFSIYLRNKKLFEK